MKLKHCGVSLRIGLIPLTLSILLFSFQGSQGQGATGWQNPSQFPGQPSVSQPRYAQSPVTMGMGEGGEPAPERAVITRKYIRRNLPTLPRSSSFQRGQYPGQSQGQLSGRAPGEARFFPWLFGWGGGGGGYGPPPPVPDHGPEYCVEYFDPMTGFSTEDCTPLY